MKVSTTQIHTSLSKLYRTGLSSYLAEDFQEKEKKIIQSLGIQYLETIEGADILITNTHSDLNNYKLDDLKKVKLIIHPNSGYDNFTVAQVKDLSAPIILGNEVRAKSVATYIISCFYHAFSNPPFSKTWDKNRAWKRKSLDNISLQIIGHGHIAKIIEKSLGHLVKDISFYDPYQDAFEFNEQADCLILACSLNNETRHMIDQCFLNNLNHRCVIINAARGQLIVEPELIEWLNNNPKASAYLDVFETEPKDFSIFPNNCYKTSHLAGVDNELDLRIINFEFKVCSDWINLTHEQFFDKWNNVYLKHRIKGNDFI